MSYRQFEHERDFDPTANSLCFPLEHLMNFTTDAPSRAAGLRPEPSRAEQLHELLLVLHEPDATRSVDSADRSSSGTNQRQFSRCPISTDRTDAILSMNGRRYDCRIVELSIGGFGVVVAGSLELTSGTVGRLRAPGMNYVVSVTRYEARPGGMYIGLRQIEEVIDETRRPGEPSSVVGYLIAGLAGAMIAMASYCLMSSM